MINKIFFDNQNYSEGELLTLACGHISLNQIIFTNQNVAINIEARTGDIEVYDLKENKILSTKIQIPMSGDERFSEVKCCVEGEQIALGFPQYRYKDNYPNCDGEHDRWSKTISCYNFLRYDYKNKCIVG